MKEILNGVFYVLRGGCSWRMLLHDLPPWRTVYCSFNNWRKAGVWEKINDGLHTAIREDVYTFTASPGQRVYFSLLDYSKGMTYVRWRLTDENETVVFDRTLDLRDAGVQTLTKVELIS